MLIVIFLRLVFPIVNVLASDAFLGLPEVLVDNHIGHKDISSLNVLIVYVELHFLYYLLDSHMNHMFTCCIHVWSVGDWLDLFLLLHNIHISHKEIVYLHVWIADVFLDNHFLSQEYLMASCIDCLCLFKLFIWVAW